MEFMSSKLIVSFFFQNLLDFSFGKLPLFQPPPSPGVQSHSWFSPSPGIFHGKFTMLFNSRLSICVTLTSTSRSFWPNCSISTMGPMDTLGRSYHRNTRSRWKSDSTSFASSQLPKEGVVASQMLFVSVAWEINFLELSFKTGSHLRYKNLSQGIPFGPYV